MESERGIPGISHAASNETVLSSLETLRAFVPSSEDSLRSLGLDGILLAQMGNAHNIIDVRRRPLFRVPNVRNDECQGLHLFCLVAKH